MSAPNVLNEKRAKTLRLVQTALLAAIEVILTLVYLPVGAINLNFGLVPIIIAGIFISPLCGALIGGVSGVVTMIQVLTGQSAFYTFLVATNPILASLLCIVKTAAAGYLSGIVYRAVNKICKYETVASIVSAALCPVVNTGIFALGMFTIFGNAMLADPEISTWTTGGLVALVFVGLIGINFFVELGLNLVLCPVLTRSLRRTKFFDK